jgi:hypothetical protein
MNWKEFFERWGKYHVDGRYFECQPDFTVEELFQAFKERMQQEAELASHHAFCDLRHGLTTCNCDDYK